jgi:hypothetical protein
LKKRPLARARTTAEATAMHRWVFPVPVETATWRRASGE